MAEDWVYRYNGLSFLEECLLTRDAFDEVVSTLHHKAFTADTDAAQDIAFFGILCFWLAVFGFVEGAPVTALVTLLFGCGMAFVGWREKRQQSRRLRQEIREIVERYECEIREVDSEEDAE